MRGRQLAAVGVMGAALLATLGNTPPPDIVEEETIVTLAAGERLSAMVELTVDQVESYRDIQASVTYRPRRAELSGLMVSGDQVAVFDLSRGDGFAYVDVSDETVEADTGMPVSTRYEATITLDNLSSEPVHLTLNTYVVFDQGEQGTLSVDASVGAI